MNRVIEFRGRNIETGKWVFGCLLDNLWNYSELHHLHGEPVTEIIVTGEASEWETVEEDLKITVDRKTVGQFTWMLDKNKNKIYESDIIELPLETGEKIRVICRFGAVQRTLDTGWLVDITGFYFERSDGLNSFPIVKNYAGKHDLELFEVVGNIYEHPHLIGK